MPNVDLTQAEAAGLLAMDKFKANDERHDYPGMGGSLTVPLASEDGREQFILDISRGRIELRRGKCQVRGRQVVVLARLDFGGAPHRNPDGEEILCPHLHLYREGFGDKWAIPVPTDHFPDIGDLWKTLVDFMEYCRIVDAPKIDRGLFA